MELVEFPCSGWTPNLVSHCTRCVRGRFRPRIGASSDVAAASCQHTRRPSASSRNRPPHTTIAHPHKSGRGPPEPLPLSRAFLHRSTSPHGQRLPPLLASVNSEDAHSPRKGWIASRVQKLDETRRSLGCVSPARRYLPGTPLRTARSRRFRSSPRAILVPCRIRDSGTAANSLRQTPHLSGSATHRRPVLVRH